MHPNASLFKAPEIKRAVQGGQAQAGEILLVNFENEDPLYGLDGIPFLATSYGESMKLYKASRKALDDKLAKQGMKLLFTVPWPPQGIYTKRTLNSVADMKGLKWRAYSPATSKIAELVGAQPVTVQAAEVSQALATGVIDSYMSSGATGYDSKTYEHIKNWYDTQAWLPKNAIIVNPKAFDALDKPTQAALLKAAADAETRGWKLSEEKNGWYVDQLKDKGMTILKPSDQLTADLRKVGNVHARRMAAQGRRRRQEGHRRLSPAAVARRARAHVPRPPLRRRRLPGGVVLGGHARHGAARHRRPAAPLPRARHRLVRRLLHGGGRLPRARAHVEARRAHPRDAAARARRRPRRSAGSSCGRSARPRCSPALFAYYSVRLAYQSWDFNDVSTGNDATPLWIPQLTMAAGTLVLFVAFVDELVLEWRGARIPKLPAEALHNE